MRVGVEDSRGGRGGGWSTRCVLLSMSMGARALRSARTLVLLFPRDLRVALGLSSEQSLPSRSEGHSGFPPDALAPREVSLHQLTRPSSLTSCP